MGGAQGCEEGVFGFFEGGFDEGTDVGGRAVAQGEAAVLVVGDGQLGGRAGPVVSEREAVPAGRIVRWGVCWAGFTPIGCAAAGLAGTRCVAGPSVLAGWTAVGRALAVRTGVGPAGVGWRLTGGALVCSHVAGCGVAGCGAGAVAVGGWGGTPEARSKARIRLQLSGYAEHMCE